jgi:predicted metalloprotease with PDZ domain
MPRVSSILALAAALLPPAAGWAQQTTRPASANADFDQSSAFVQGAQSAPISGVRYDVTFDSTTAATRQLHVAMSFTVDGQGPVLLSLPSWTPGAYEVGNFARWVSAFSATSAGKTLSWDKLDFDTWRVRTDGAKSVTVAFDYLADSLDNAIAWANGDFVFFNGTNVFMYAEGRPLEFAATVTVHAPADWRVATGMPPAAAPRAYSAANFHDLVDFPFFIGRFDYDSTRVGDRWVRLASWPVGALAGANRAKLLDDHRKMLPPEIAVTGDAPFANYTTFIVFDSTSGGGSALEHQSSHLGIYSPLLVGSVLLPSITAHEMFHAWNVKRLRPADMWPYRYDRPQPTPWLWVSEGITDYYADLALVRGGIIDSSGFLQLTNGKAQEVSQTPPTALEDASLSTWIHPADGSGYLYYPKGSLAGFLLDIQIRDASDNKKSLDDVMRELYASDYKQGKGFTFDDWWGAVRRAANGRSFDDFYRRYVDGRDPFPYATVLPLAGFAMKVDTTWIPRVGVQTGGDSTGVRVVAVDPTGAAAQAGVRAGDVLLSVGEIPVADATFGARFRQRYQRSSGETVPVRVKRGEQTLTLSMKIVLEMQLAEELTLDPRASAKAVRIRSGILHGTTDR